MFYKYSFIIALFFLSFCVACQKEDQDKYAILTTFPDGFPALNITEGNEFTLERWQLGKKLFYEKLLSKDSTISCASCHKTAFAFSDNKATTPGVFNLEGTRNAPTLTNIGFQPYFTKEGGIKTLEQQVLIPLQEHNEMSLNILDAGILLNNIEDYKKQSLKAYDREMDYYVITRALSCFERTLISSNSDYDLALENKYTYTESEQKGKNLFYSSKTNCSECHSGVLFTSFEFFNNGLYQNYNDVGKYRLTLDSNDIGVFKVPTLRNISVTAPYMHDGSLESLSDVVEHYNSGGKIHNNKNGLVKPLHLTSQEKLDLINFLETLTDHSFINNKLFKNE